MALVLPVATADTYMEGKLVVTGETTTALTLADGKSAGMLKTFPAQGDYPDGASFVMLTTNFIDWAESLGPKGTMTAEDIMGVFGDQGMTQATAETLADDFAVAMGNYVVIPKGDVSYLVITTKPVNSIHDLMIVETTEEAAPEV